MEVDTDEFYEVEKILSKKFHNGHWLYKTKWAGYPIEDCTWEPLASFTESMEIITEFEEEQKQKQGDKKKHHDDNESDFNGNVKKTPKEKEKEKKNDRDTNKNRDPGKDDDKDQPLKIVDCRIISCTKDNVEFNVHVEWSNKQNQTASSWISSKELEKTFPQFWINYLYSHIIFPKEI